MRSPGKGLSLSSVMSAVYVFSKRTDTGYQISELKEGGLQGVSYSAGWGRYSMMVTTFGPGSSSKWIKGEGMIEICGCGWNRKLSLPWESGGLLKDYRVKVSASRIDRRCESNPEILWSIYG